MRHLTQHCLYFYPSVPLPEQAWATVCLASPSLIASSIEITSHLWFCDSFCDIFLSFILGRSFCNLYQASRFIILLQWAFGFLYLQRVKWFYKTKEVLHIPKESFLGGCGWYLLRMFEYFLIYLRYYYIVPNHLIMWFQITFWWKFSNLTYGWNDEFCTLYNTYSYLLHKIRV